jgi:hypothetical protein
VLHVEGDDGGTETIDAVGHWHVSSLIIILAPPPPGPVITVRSALLCSVLLSNTFPVPTPDPMPNYNHRHASTSYSNSLDFFSTTLVSPHVRG